MCLAYQSGGKTTYKILNTSSAEDVNKIFKDTMGYEPPYKPGTSVTEIQLTENATYVRVYDKVNSRMQGGWVMKAEDIVGLTPQEIQNKFALPNTPKYICDVNLEAVTRLRTGEVNPLFGFDGGAIGTAVGESLEKVDGGKDRSLWTITQDSLVLGGVSKGLNFVSHTAITFDAYYWMKIALNKETENVIEAGLVGAGSNVYSSIRETMEEKKGKCQYK